MRRTGYGGIDCSTHWPTHGGPPVNVHHRSTARDDKQGTEGSERERFFVVEMPARLVTHALWYMRVRWDHDMGRIDSWAFLQHCLRSKRRTLDPADARYLVMPVMGNRHMNRHVAWYDALALYGDALRSKPVVCPHPSTKYPTPLVPLQLALATGLAARRVPRQPPPRGGVLCVKGLWNWSEL